MTRAVGIWDDRYRFSMVGEGIGTVGNDIVTRNGLGGWGQTKGSVRVVSRRS